MRNRIISPALVAGLAALPPRFEVRAFEGPRGALARLARLRVVRRVRRGTYAITTFGAKLAEHFARKVGR